MNWGIKMTDPLDDMFQAARREDGRAPPPALRARVMADAARITRTRRPWYLRITPSTSGWGAGAGLAAAAFTGFWIGVNPPDLMLDYDLNPFTSSYEADLSGFGWSQLEETIDG